MVCADTQTTLRQQSSRARKLLARSPLRAHAPLHSRLRRGASFKGQNKTSPLTVTVLRPTENPHTQDAPASSRESNFYYPISGDSLVFTNRVRHKSTLRSNRQARARAALFGGHHRMPGEAKTPTLLRKIAVETVSRRTRSFARYRRLKTGDFDYI